MFINRKLGNSLFIPCLCQINVSKLSLNVTPATVELPTSQRILLAIKGTLCVLHTSFMQLLSIYKNEMIMSNVILIR